MSIVSEAIWAASPSTTRGQPTQLSADPKGERIAYASGKSIFLRSIDHPELSKQYTAHTSQTSVARFSPSGFYIASGDVSGSVRVWDAVGEGATKGEYPIIAGRINDIAWDGDSQRIIAVGDGKERFGHCITADSGNSVGEISGQSAQINSVSIRQQRPLRAATGSDDTTVAFYHGAPFKFNTSLRGQHSRFVYGTAFSPDGNTLVSVGADRKIWLYDGKTGESNGQIGGDVHKGSIFGVSWSKDSKSFATASADRTVKIWDVEAGKATQSWTLGEEGTVYVQDQQMGVAWPHGRSDGLVISIDLEGNLNYLVPGNTKPTKIIHGHQGNVTASAISTHGGSPTLFTGSYEGRIRAWDIASGKASTIDGEQSSNYVSALASSDSARIFSAAWDDSLRTIDSSVKAFVGNVPTRGQPKGAAYAAMYKQICVATDVGISTYSSDGQETHDVRIAGCTSIAASSELVAVGLEGKSISVYQLSSSGPPTQTKSLTDAKITSQPTVLSFSPDNALLAVGLSSGSILVYECASWSLKTSRWSAHTARVTSLAWAADGQFCISGSLDTNIFVWSLKEPGRRIKAVNAHKDGVNGVSWVEEEGKKKAISVGGDAAVKVWNVEGL